jgi:hypothetical protein
MIAMAMTLSATQAPMTSSMSFSFVVRVASL